MSTKLSRRVAKWKPRKKGNVPNRISLTKAEIDQLRYSMEWDPQEELMDIDCREEQQGHLFPM